MCNAFHYKVRVGQAEESKWFKEIPNINTAQTNFGLVK